MNGMLQQAPKSKSNPMLDQIVQQAEAQVPENLKSEFLSIMTVGGKMMWSDEMTDERASFDQALQQAGNVPEVVSHAVLKIISIIQNESGRDKPLDSVGLAAPIFMSHILQYVESKHGIPVTADIIAQTGQMTQINLAKHYGVTDEILKELFRSKAQGQLDGEQPQPQPTPEADETDEVEADEATEEEE